MGYENGSLEMRRQQLQCATLRAPPNDDGKTNAGSAGCHVLT